MNAHFLLNESLFQGRAKYPVQAFGFVTAFGFFAVENQTCGCSTAKYLRKPLAI